MATAAEQDFHTIVRNQTLEVLTAQILQEDINDGYYGPETNVSQTNAAQVAAYQEMLRLAHQPEDQDDSSGFLGSLVRGATSLFRHDGR